MTMMSKVRFGAPALAGLVAITAGQTAALAQVQHQDALILAGTPLDRALGFTSQVAGPSQLDLATLLSLALAGAVVFALNLWFARHVKRVHAFHRNNRR